jgi:hypothetical protein
MATREELYTALRNADASGDNEGAAKLAKYIQSLPADSAPAATLAPAQDNSVFGQIKQGAGNLVAGAVRGAGSIGATLLAPVDAAARALNGGKPVQVGGYDLLGQDRRTAMDQGLTTLGAQPDSLMYKGGKLATEVAGTAGAGGLVANGLRAAVPLLTKVAPTVANTITNFAPAIESGGLTLGSSAPTNALSNILLRAGGGAVNGAATTALVNPSDALEGGALGAVLPGAVKLAGAAGGVINQGAKGAIKHALGMSTGTGGEAVATAFNAGKDGGTSFLDNMRGNVPMTDVLDSAKSALTKMRIDRAAEYRNGMAGVSADKTVIDFAPIDQAVSNLKSMGTYKGQVINKNASGVVDDISALVDKWKGLDPAEYHTPEGLDALKQAISDIRDTTQFGTAGRKAADTAYNAVKTEITNQAPTYAKVMKDYSQASETLSEVERALSLGNKAAADTSMRKLQSLMRNNVNTNFGNRVGLAKTLEDNGAEILPAVAGQAMSSWTPRGLAGLAASGAGVAGMLSHPLALAGLPATSPRLVGEAAYGLGAATRGAANVSSAAQSKLMQLLGQRGQSQIGMSQLSPFLASAPMLAATQR